MFNYNEEATKNPIWKTDFSKPLLHLIEELRDQLSDTRGQIHDIERAYPGLKERIHCVEGLLTCGISTLYDVKQCVYDVQLSATRSLPFYSRGIGSDNYHCFICGGQGRLVHNISAFVKSKEDGETIVKWFKQGAHLDFRSYEPNYIQVKVGACKEHLSKLEELNNAVSVGMINKEIVDKFYVNS